MVQKSLFMYSCDINCVYPALTISLLQRVSVHKYFFQSSDRQFSKNLGITWPHDWLTRNFRRRQKANIHCVKPIKWLFSFHLYRRVRNRYYYVYNGTKQTKIAKKPFRYNFTYHKGSTYVILSRGFAKFSLTNPVAKEFLEWVKDTGHPDETFYSTLYSNLHLVNATVFIISKLL